MEKHKFNIFPEMNEDDYYRLKSDIERNGYDNSQPIYIFDGFILDGWNRYKACQELDVTPVIKEFHGNEIAALEFVMRTNKRRNLTSSQWAAIAVEADDIWDVLQEDIERERRKKQAEKIKLTERDNTGKFKPVYDNKLTQTETERTTQRMADMFNTNRTYVNDAKKYRNENPEVFEEIKNGTKSISEIKRPHVSNNSGENEWYTPFNIIESARVVMGSIDLDPASSESANNIVKATKYYTKEDNGLEQSWFGNIWLNPPYSQPLVKYFTNAVVSKISDYNQIMILVNNATETDWFQKIFLISDAVCFIKGRVKFIDKDGKNMGAPLQGQSILYIGINIDRFKEEFNNIGICVSRI